MRTSLVHIYILVIQIEPLFVLGGSRNTYNLIRRVNDVDGLILANVEVE